ncbi:MAG: hypothetical protein GX589_03370 [Deltaproteobacteria bacterium]|nr:hypothetical protein [Deltaproteobacteria bacterium]
MKTQRVGGGVSAELRGRGGSREGGKKRVAILFLLSLEKVDAPRIGGSLRRFVTAGGWASCWWRFLLVAFRVGGALGPRRGSGVGKERVASWPGGDRKGGKERGAS